MDVVIHATEFPPGPGGIGAHAHALARGFHHAGWTVQVVAPQEYVTVDEVRRFIAGEPYRITSLAPVRPALREGGLRLSRVLGALNRTAGEGQMSTVLIASGQRALWVSAAAAAARRLPLLAVVHGSELDSRVQWQRRLTGWSLRRADAIVSVSRFTATFLTQYGVDPSRVEVIPNGADNELFRVLSPTEPRIAALAARLELGGGPVLLTIGNLTERKGQDVVVRALPAIRRLFPDVTYVMVGLPTSGDALRALADELGVGHAIRVAGRLAPEELVAAANLADLVVMTSRHTGAGDFEGFGIAVVEGALCGTPAVVSGGSGLAEAVADGVTGLVVPQDDPSRTAAAVNRLLSDPEVRARMGAAARQRALSEQTWRRRIEQYIGICGGLAAGRSPVEQ